jgi:hypothetical protein
MHRWRLGSRLRDVQRKNTQEPHIDMNKNDVLRAIDEFDSAWRHKSEWQDWENNKAHKYGLQVEEISLRAI